MTSKRIKNKTIVITNKTPFLITPKPNNTATIIDMKNHSVSHGYFESKNKSKETAPERLYKLKYKLNFFHP